MCIKRLLIPIFLTLIFISCEEAALEPEECVIPEETCRQETVDYTEIPNLNFEEWTSSSSGYEQPWPGNFWATPNEATEFFSGGAVVQSVSGDQTFDGTGNAAKLVTRRNLSPLSDALPVTAGSIVSGRYSTDLNNPARSFRFGRPFNRKITSISGYYKYLPEGNDRCGMYLLMRTCSNVEDACGNSYGMIDTIAMDVFRTSATVEEYTGFELELEYESEAYPDQVILYFTSSDGASSGGGSVGSTLYLDQLSVAYE